MNAIKMIRADLSPVFSNPRGESLDDSQITEWEGAVMFEAPYDIALDKLEALADETVSTWANVTEWSIEVICTGLYRLTPRDWNTIPAKKLKECLACKCGEGKCSC